METNLIGIYRYTHQRDESIENSQKPRTGFKVKETPEEVDELVREGRDLRISSCNNHGALIRKDFRKHTNSQSDI